MSRNYKQSTRADKGESATKSKNGKKFVKRNKSSKFQEANLKTEGYDNKPGYYFTSPELADQVSQLSFQEFLGASKFDDYSVPSILRVNTVLCPGNTENVMSVPSPTIIHKPTEATVDPGNYVIQRKAGVNLMGAKFYTTLSQFTGRTASYGPQDVSLMILALCSIAELSEHIRRMFGIALTYNVRNRTLPLGVLRSMLPSSFAVNEFIKSISVLRTRFNVAMARINQIPLLENVAIIDKSREFYQKVYQDDPTNMSQLWYYCPQYAYILNETALDRGTILEARTLTGSDSSVPGLLALLEEMIDAMLESSTLNFVYADILNMANKLNVKTWQFDYLAENYVVMPEYNLNANMMLKNGVIVGIPNVLSTPTFAIYNGTTHMRVTEGPHIYSDANTNDVVYNPIFQNNSSAARSKKHVFSVYTDRPTVEDRIEFLRLTSLASGMVLAGTSIGRSSTSYWITAQALPDHYIAEVRMYRNYTQNGDFDVLTTFSSSYADYGESVQSVLDAAEASAQFTAFPMFWATLGNARKKLYGTLDYYTEVDYDYIKRVLDAMMVGLFDFRV